ncbi:MAG TPA: hypothetical protein VGE07_14755 [Herpetosiphonaceae bacterium]
MRFERSWIPGIVTLAVAVIISTQILKLPFTLRGVLGAAIAGWLLWTGVQILRGRSGLAHLPRSGGPKVQYWRGQRVVLDDGPARRPRSLALPPWPQASGAIGSVLIGLSALVILGMAFAANFI